MLWPLYISISRTDPVLAEHPEVLRVRFDPELGYPKDGYCDITSMMADEEMGFELKSVLPP